MSFGFGTNKKHQNHDSMWTSYADLFLGLSVIFLLLYVTASLRQGTDGIRQHLDNQKLSRENEDLKQQLKIYNSIRQNYLDTQANQDEQKTYEMLMSKLNLLQDDAKTEKQQLEKQAQENADKEQALNKYQQTIRNIINANLLAKSRIKNRDVLLTKDESTIQGQSNEIGDLQSDLNQKRVEIDKNQAKIDDLNLALKKKLKQLKSAYKQNQLTENSYRKKQEALTAEANRKMAALAEQRDKDQKDLAEISGRLNQANGEKSKLQGELSKSNDQIKGLQGDLAQARENLNARKKLAQNIKAMFKANGVNADVDAKTGDVLLPFDGEYFNTGEAKLKPGMKKVLERAMPAYAQSLFQDPKISNKIENVEIVGFASPTYRGKYVDPSKLNGTDRDAVNYNLDLSYSRARSIFDHMLTKMQFDHKQQLLHLVKVTGRSFLHEDHDRSPANASQSGFCKEQDCARLQTVIIRFKLKD